MSLADVLRKAIENSGKPLTGLARECGVPQPMLTRFMAGYDIRLATAEKLADYFGLKLCPESKGKAKKKGG
jgi:plasmid maintenance system antidote protein VapI